MTDRRYHLRQAAAHAAKAAHYIDELVALPNLDDKQDDIARISRALSDAQYNMNEAIDKSTCAIADP